MNNTLTPLLLLAVAVGLFYMYISPWYAEVEELKVRQTKYVEALDRVKEIQAIRDDLLSRFNSFAQVDIDRLETMLPDKVDDVRLVLDINGIAQKYGTEIQDVRVDKPQSDAMLYVEPGTPTKPYETVRIVFSVEMTYKDFTSFMADVEESLRILDVENVVVRPKLGNEYDFIVTVSTYWLK